MRNGFVIENGWKNALRSYCESDSFATLFNFIINEYSTKKIFPEFSNIFKAFEVTPFSQVRVVILGQDPYHDDGQACGMCFSVPNGITVPPSLKNIYKEIISDTGIVKDMSLGSLEDWAKQGVFLLNSVLTVVAHMPLSHKDVGWEDFTDTVIRTISGEHDHVVFMLWGKHAVSKKSLIDETKHLVLEAPHPSPLSAHRGFFGCKHFSQCNSYLKNNDKKVIQW